MSRDQIDLTQPLVINQGKLLPNIASANEDRPKPKALQEADDSAPAVTKAGVFQSFYQLAGLRTAPEPSTSDLRPIADLLPTLGNSVEGLEHDELAAKLLETLKSPLLSDSNLRTRFETSCHFIDALATEALPAAAVSPVNFAAGLKLPLLRLALLQPELLEPENGQAAALINQIGLAQSLAGKDPTLHKALENFVRTLAEKLLTEKESKFETTIQQANCRLQELLVPVLQRKQRYQQHLIDGFEGRQKLAQSKLAVYEALRERFSGKSVPDLIVTLLKAGWYHLLVLSHLRYSQDSPQWQNRIEVLDRLLEWLAVDPEVHLPQAEANHLINQVDSGLGMVLSDTEQHRQLVQQLADCLTGPHQGERRKALIKNPVDPKQFIEPQFLIETEADKFALVKALSLGDWIRVQQNGKSIPYKLVWIGPPRLCTCSSIRAVQARWS